MAGAWEAAWARRTRRDYPVGVLCREDWLPEGGLDPILEIAECLLETGSRPVLVSSSRRPACRALVVPGGADVDPSFYGQKPGPGMEGRELIPEFDRFCLGTIRLALYSAMPMLAICRGMQLLNVALGGSLIQHLSEARGHQPDWVAADWRLWVRPAHSLFVERDSLMFDLFGVGRLEVNSCHHQGLDRLANRLRVTGRSGDGLVEAVEVRGARRQYGVQYHPEALRHTDPRQLALFAALRACGMDTITSSRQTMAAPPLAASSLA